MFTKFRSYLLFILLIALLSLGSLGQSTALAGDSYSQKIEALRAELGGYHSSLRPNERYGVGERINAALLAVLQEEDSLTAKPEDILGGGGQFALVFGDWVSAGEIRHRLIILRPYQIDMGAMTTVFAQTRSGDKVSMAEKLHSLVQTTTIGQLVYAEIIAAGDGLFLPLVEKRYGPEHKYITIYTWKLADGGWQVYSRPPGVTEKGEWAIRSGPKSFVITHSSLGWKSQNDYMINASRGEIEIQAIDKDNTPFDSITVRLVDGTWVIK